MAHSPIRVLLVEDSPVALVVLKRLLDASPEIEVVGTARTGREAMALIPKIQPTVICTDLHMPEMDGLELTRAVMAHYPRPILAISASVQQENTRNVFQLLDAGAVDVFPKPQEGFLAHRQETAAALIRKIKVLAGVSVFTKHCWKRGMDATDRATGSGGKRRQLTHQMPTRKLSDRTAAIASCSLAPPSKIVAIGASTGGPTALQTILKQLSPNFPAPIFCVQHISKGFLQGLVDWLSFDLALSVKIAEEGELPQAGIVYFPPEQQHLELDRHGRFLCSSKAAVSGHRPSITVTFKSVAQVYRGAAVGILLTGMGSDGAEGLREIAQAGGITIAQNEETCVVFGMPKTAIAIGAAQHTLPLTEIAPRLLALLRS